jgi:hypothetical protein
MKVRILSGNQAGAIVEMGQTEGENAVATGYAEPFVTGLPVEPVPVAPKVEENKERSRSRGRREA